MKRAGLIAIAAVTAACSPPTNLLPVNDFNRPTDVAFMCFGVFQNTAGTTPDGGQRRRRRRVASLRAADAGVPSSEPVRSGRDDPDPHVRLHAQQRRRHAVGGRRRSLEAARSQRRHQRLWNRSPRPASRADLRQRRRLPAHLGEPGLVRSDAGRSVGPGGAHVPAGDRRRCDAAVAAHGVPDVPSHQERRDPPDGPAVRGGVLAAGHQQPAGPAAAPAALPLQQQQTQMCGDSAAANPLGWPDQEAKYWYVLVTYPSCDLITLVELPSGQMVSSAYVRETTDPVHGKSVKLVDAGKSPVCSSATCAGQALPPSFGVTSDAGLRSDAAGTVDAQGPRHRRPACPTERRRHDAGGGTAGMPGSTGTGGASGTGGTPGSAGASGRRCGSHRRIAGRTRQPVPQRPLYRTGPIGPSGIAILPDASRAYVSLANASYVIRSG